jgi:hypothetical protein
MKKAQLQLEEIQVAFYFKEAFNDPQTLIKPVNEKLEILDDVPTITPLPQGRDLIEVPVVQMRNTKNSHELTISRGRMDYRFHPEDEKEEPAVKDKIEKQTTKLLGLLVENNIHVKWVGIVYTFFVVGEDARAALAELVPESLKNISGEETSEVIIHHSSKGTINKIQSNNIISMAFATKQNKETENEPDGVIIKRDLNTKPDSQEITPSLYKQYLRSSEKALCLEDIKNLLCC